MTIMIKTLALGAGFAALAAATPANAQYYPPYGNAYGYHANMTNVAAERCAAAVQNRLSVRGSTGILGTLFGVRSYNNARVLSVTQVVPRANSVRVRGVASSGRLAYNPYGVGAYGMLGSNYAQPTADLRFNCTVDYRGFVRDIDINRR
ncbi:MAG: hypothetical protein M3Q19_13550 [Pseudomonadota bacterium]|nr:hypothetical protein [Pseudomonadota bacterium]